MRALIFGGRGLLGQALAGALRGRGHAPVALAHADADVTDLDGVRRAVREQVPDVLFNCAAYTRVDEAEAEPGVAYAVNGAGARNVAVAAAEGGLPVVHISSDYVFDGASGTGYREWDPLSPRSVYGCSQALGEFQVRAVNPRHIIVRTQWLYGPGGENFVRTMLRLGAEQRQLQVAADQTGSPTYARDLAAALVTLAEVRACGTYHITNSGHCTWQRFAETIFALSGLPVQVEPITTAELHRAAQRPLHAVLINEMWQADGRAPLRRWEEALADFLH